MPERGYMDLETVNRREIAGYLGIKNGEPDEKMRGLIEECLLELNEKVSPKHVFRVFPLVLCADEETIDFTCFPVKSRNLYRNLAGCEEVLLFAATIGQGADFIIRRYEKTKMSRALVCQAAAAAMIEAYCNELNDNWKREYEAKGCFLKPRFSCGYGDFALAHQKDFLRVLEMEKHLGIHLNDALLMVPTKSVTAVIGIGRRTEKGNG